MIAFKDALAVSDRQFAVASAHHKMDIHRSLEVFADVFGDFARLFAEELVIRNGKYSNLLALLRSIGMEFSESRNMETKCPSPSFGSSQAIDPSADMYSPASLAYRKCKASGNFGY